MPDVLFQPFNLKGLALPNRVVLAPMSRHRAVDGVPGPDSAAYYKRRAEAGVGLIITEGTFLDHPASGDTTDTPRLIEAAADGLKLIADEVHAVGGRVFCQLWHIGLAHANSLTPDAVLDQGARYVGPSGIDGGGAETGSPMSETEIADVIASYARGAAMVKRLGFDGLEIHAGHGYLIDQFLWARTNKRTDKYGGDLVARTRFAVEVLRAVRAEVGDDFPISMRLSQWKIQDYDAVLAETPDELAQLLAPLTAAGADLFHCSSQRYWDPAFAGSDLNLAGWVKKLTGMPAMAVGSVGLDTDVMDQENVANPTDIERLLEMMERGDFDLIAVGRALIANPDWVEKVQRGAAPAEMKPFSYADMAVMA